MEWCLNLPYAAIITHSHVESLLAEPSIFSDLNFVHKIKYQYKEYWKYFLKLAGNYNNNTKNIQDQFKA